MRWMALILAAVLMVGCTAGGGGTKPAEPVPQQPPAEQKAPAEQPPVSQSPPAAQKPPVTADEVKAAVGAKATEIVGALKIKDTAKVARMVHPTKGVRFSPYFHVDLSKDVAFQSRQLDNIMTEKKLYTWGTHAASGEPIQGTFADYYQKFIYDLDFAAAPQVGYNQILGKGTIIDNVKEAYPAGIFVEYHFPGVEPTYQGMDWRSLRLIFEQQGKEWYLTGVMHGQWTP